jgi:hypothetical protein
MRRSCRRPATSLSRPSRAADAHAAHREQLLTQVEQNLSTDPDDALSTAAIDSVHSNIDDAVDKRFLTPDAALAEKKAAARRIAAAHYRKMAAEDPSRAIDELTADESPHPVVKHLASATHDALVAPAQYNLTAHQVDAERNTALAAKAHEATADETERTYIDEAFAGTPDLGRRVANDNALTPESRSRLLLMLRRTAQPDPPAAVSQAATLALVGRIRRGDGDPEKIGDRARLLDAYNDGNLSAADYRFVANQLDDAATHGTVPLAAEPRAAGTTVLPAVDGEAPGPANQGEEPTAPQTSPQDLTAPPTPGPPEDTESSNRGNEPGTRQPPQPFSGELRAYQPSVSERFKYTLQDALMATGLKPYDAAHLADAFSNLASFYPPVAYAFGADNFKRAVERGDVPAAMLAATTLIPGLRGASKRIFKIAEPGLPTAATRELLTPIETSGPARLEQVPNELSPPGTAESTRPSKGKDAPAISAPRQAEAFASLGAARQRIADAGLEHFTGRADTPEVLDAIKRGTAADLGNRGVGFNTSDTFKDYVGHASPGYEWHHIVPQHDDNIDAFGNRAIHSTSNMILLPEDVHLTISKNYSRGKSRGTSGLTLRDELKPMTFDEQHKEGVSMIIEALKAHGLATP